MLVSIYNVSLKVNLLSVTFDPETAEIRLLIMTHPSAAITLHHQSCDISSLLCFDKSVTQSLVDRLNVWFLPDIIHL